MINSRMVIVLILGIAFIVGFRYLQQTPRVCYEGGCLNVEVVSKRPDMQKGLSGRSTMPNNHGMLFVFSDNNPHNFWMKDMEFSLDILWIDANDRIIHLEENLPPCHQIPCHQYSAQSPSRYVLEIPAGYAHTHHLKPGDTLNVIAKPSL